MSFVYFAQSLKNQKVYVGSTEKNPDKRIKEHNKGVNKFTKENRPYKLIYYEKYLCHKDALNREKFYKTGFGKYIKKAIIETLKTFKGR